MDGRNEVKDIEVVKREIHADMLATKQEWHRRFPGEDWETNLYAGWHAAAREAHYWRSRAMILAGVAAGLCVWLIAVL